MTDSTTPVGAGGAAESIGREPPPKRKRRVNPETMIRKSIVKYLRSEGWFVFHNLQGLGCFPGISDLTAMRGGRIVWIEIKTPNGKQNYDQWAFEREVTTNGCEYLIARSVDDVRTLEVQP
jgi:hypothetical protein